MNRRAATLAVAISIVGAAAGHLATRAMEPDHASDVRARRELGEVCHRFAHLARLMEPTQFGGIDQAVAELAAASLVVAHSCIQPGADRKRHNELVGAWDSAVGKCHHTVFTPEQMTARCHELASLVDGHAEMLSR